MKTYAYIDASNLFYGGEKSLGWSIDYQKLAYYLKEKYGVEHIRYFGGIDICGYEYDYLKYDSVPLTPLTKYLENEIIKRTKDSRQTVKFYEALAKLKFYKKIAEFGFRLCLKPVKEYRQEDGSIRHKANCDVDLTFYVMKESSRVERFIVLTGDGDYLPVLKYLRNDLNREVIILARGPRSAREIRQFAGEDFRDFVTLKKHIKFEKTEKDGHTKYPPQV